MLLTIAVILLILSVVGLLGIFVGSAYEALTAMFQHVLDSRARRLRRKGKGVHRADYLSATAIRQRFAQDMIDHYEIMSDDPDHFCDDLCAGIDQLREGQAEPKHRKDDQ